MKDSLSKKGLSMSQAMAVANLIYQKTVETDQKIGVINNYSSKITIDGSDHILVKESKIPADITKLILEKGKLHGAQAFLMSNLKAKEARLKNLKLVPFEYGNKEGEEEPSIPELETFRPEPLVTEDWGWDQLSAKEVNEYLENEALAAHIGLFIHKGGKLDSLRTELPTLKSIEWTEIETGKKTPIKITAHNTSEELLKIHTELAAEHRKYEQRANYFKAKVKDLVSKENARIAKENATGQGAVNDANKKIRDKYTSDYSVWSGTMAKARQTFEQDRQNEINATAALRIEVDPRFKDTIDEYMALLDTKE